MLSPFTSLCLPWFSELFTELIFIDPQDGNIYIKVVEMQTHSLLLSYHLLWVVKTM